MKLKFIGKIILSALTVSLIIISTGFLGHGVFWGIKAAFGYGGGGGGYYPPAVNENINAVPVIIPIPTLNPVESPTNSSYVILTGAKEANLKIFINDSADSITYPNDNTWQALRFLDLGSNIFNIYAKDNLGNPSNALIAEINRIKTGDITGDNIIDDLDLASLAAHWGENWPQGDLNGDGIIDDLDLAILAGRWGI